MGWWLLMGLRGAVVAVGGLLRCLIEGWVLVILQIIFSGLLYKTSL